MKVDIKSDRIVIVGGCGHVGIPLGLAFAARDFDVTLLDRNLPAVDTINAGRLPFKENGAQEILERYLGRTLRAASDPAPVQTAHRYFCCRDAVG